MTMLFALVRKELLILARDGHGLAVLFLMPAVFILIMSLALRDAMDPSAPPPTDYIWVDQDGGPQAERLAEILAGRKNLGRSISSPRHGAVPAALAGGEAHFGVQLLPGLEQGISAPGTAQRPLAIVFVAPRVPPAVRELFIGEMRGALAVIRAEYVLADELGLSPADARLMQSQLHPDSIALRETLALAGPETAPPNATQQSVPAWIVFAMFFVVLPIATSVLTERETGSLQRLSLLNIGPARLLAAKVPAYYLVNLVQAGLMLLVGVVLVPRLGGQALSLGNSPLGLLMVASGLSFAAIGFALLVAVLARSIVQATTIGGIANLLLGAIGGIMVPKMVMPEIMQTASMASPMSWALEGAWDILLRGGTTLDVLPETLALCGFGGLCYGAASLLFKPEAR